MADFTAFDGRIVSLCGRFADLGRLVAVLRERGEANLQKLRVLTGLAVLVNGGARDARENRSRRVQQLTAEQLDELDRLQGEAAEGALEAQVAAFNAQIALQRQGKPAPGGIFQRVAGVPRGVAVQSRIALCVLGQ